MFDKYGHDSVCKDIDELMVVQGLSIFGTVCNVVNPETHTDEKTILLYSKENDALSKTFEGLLSAMGESELLQTFDMKRGGFGESKWAYYKLKNLSCTRKKYEVMFRAHYV